MEITYPFDIEIILFNKNDDFTPETIVVRDKLLNKDIYEVIQIAIDNLQNKYKVKISNNKVPIILSHDEKKELTLLSLPNSLIDLPKYKYSLYFVQKQLNNQYFTISELKEITDKLKDVFEEYLGYEIDDPIIFLDTSIL
jgi:hypothetical protein